MSSKLRNSKDKRKKVPPVAPPGYRFVKGARGWHKLPIVNYRPKSEEDEINFGTKKKKKNKKRKHRNKIKNSKRPVLIPLKNDGSVNFQSMPYSVYIKSEYWYKTRDAYVKENPFCVLCSKRTTLHVHHLRYRDEIGRTILGRETPNDLRTLCRNCHKKLHYYRMESLLLDDTYYAENIGRFRKYAGVENFR